MYSILRPLLFCLDPEKAHDVTLHMLKYLERLQLLPHAKYQDDPFHAMGLHFKNRVGLAAGLDKNGEYIDALAAFGFGFIEIGTVTVKPQSGNPKPRLFRLIKDKAIINRMGFNSLGMEYMLAQLEKTQYQGVLGVNIGKNKETPLAKAVQDYETLFYAFADKASYITVNISSPNTEGLRNLQETSLLQELLRALKTAQAEVQRLKKRYVPLVLKIAPDLSQAELEQMMELFVTHRIDGVIATNTTIKRPSSLQDPSKNESGGLSGAPLLKDSNDVLLKLQHLKQHGICIIASGGVMDRESAKSKWQNGADCVQCYTGLVYEGPRLIREVLEARR